MAQKLILTGDSFDKVNEYLENGWKVVSITAQHVSTGSTVYSKSGDFAVLLEKIDFFGSDCNKPVTYTEEEVSRLLETQRGNCYVAIYNYTTNQELATVAGAAPEPGQWRK